MEIVTIYNDSSCVLTSKAEEVSLDREGLLEANLIARNLMETLLPLMPAAGLAAPQIGIRKKVFIFTWDRTGENLEVAINPNFEPLEDSIIMGWEACFSSAPIEGPCRATNLQRYHKIRVSYYNLDGKEVNQILEGFAAKVFQHEYDHLQGLVNVQYSQVEVKEFPTFEKYVAFMNIVKQKDSTSYTKPKNIG